MANHNGANQEVATARRPFDVMVATFADRETAKEAYKALKGLEREGRISFDSALVLDRDEQGHMSVSSAKLPKWVWAVIGVSALVTFGTAALLAFLIVRAIMSRVRKAE